MADSRPTAYLVDTNVISNRGRIARDPHLSEWLRRFAAVVRISVITVAEMKRGLLMLEAKVASLSDRKVAQRERERLANKQEWYDEIVARFPDRLEPIDIAVAEKWAEISIRFPSLRDGDKIIAATAVAKGYGVATQNVGDFRSSGLPLVNPCDRATWDDGEADPIAPLLSS
jgi:predicted nucleic acid-binding protein